MRRVLGLAIVAVLGFALVANAGPARYNPRRAGHPLRIAAYVAHPVGVILDTLIFHPAALDTLKGEIRQLKGSTARVDVASFKERYGITRKYAIPLLEYLDRERVTKRVGESRIVL